MHSKSLLIFLLVFISCFSVAYGMTINCFQESVNITNQSNKDGGLYCPKLNYSGSFTLRNDFNWAYGSICIDGYCSNPYQLYDGDYETYNTGYPTTVGANSFIIFTYKKPAVTYLYNSTWFIKSENFTGNVIIPNDCIDFSLNNVSLKINSRDSNTLQNKYYCYNGTWKFLITTQGADSLIYEEGINWTISNYNLCIGNQTACKTPYYLNGYWRCNYDDIVSNCYACKNNELNFISNDSCSLGYCQNDEFCDYDTKQFCLGNTLAMVCLLSTDGCIHRYVNDVCQNGVSTCQNGVCALISSQNISSSSNVSGELYNQDAAISRLNFGSKLMILLLLCVFISILGFTIGKAMQMPQFGFILSIAGALIVFICASIPSFPIIGGFIPVWFIFAFGIIFITVLFLFIRRGNQYAEG